MLFTNMYILEVLDFLKIFKLRKKFDVVYQNYAFIGLLCLFMVYYYSNRLLIPFKDLAIITILVSVFITVVFFKFYRRNFTIFWALIHNLSIGLIVMFFVVWSNDNLSTRASFKEIVPIENVKLQDNHQRRNRALEPVITINIKGEEHNITYEELAFKKIMRTKEVRITLKKGFWGYWVLMDIELIEN